MSKRFNGFTTDTMKKRLLDAGAFFKNYDLSKTYADNKKAGNLICATQGGGSFGATPSVRQVQVDGLHTYTKGTEEIDDWTVELSLKLLEQDADICKMCLGAADVSDAESPTGYLRVKPRDTFTDDDYIDNVTWVGRWMGSTDPVIIVIYNALNIQGLNWTMEDKKETITELKFTAHFLDPDTNDDVPFDIFYPKKGV